MRTVISLNNPEQIYNVPNFCICDPIYEKDFTMFESNSDNFKQKYLTITLIYVFDNTQHTFEVSNKIYGKELKALYADATNKPLNKYRLRLLLKGQEIRDDHPLFFYGIDEDNRIQVSIAEL
jgi:hypothetical protein